MSINTHSSGASIYTGEVPASDISSPTKPDSDTQWVRSRSSLSQPSLPLPLSPGDVATMVIDSMAPSALSKTVTSADASQVVEAWVGALNTDAIAREIVFKQALAEARLLNDLVDRLVDRFAIDTVISAANAVAKAPDWANILTADASTKDAIMAQALAGARSDGSADNALAAAVKTIVNIAAVKASPINIAMATLAAEPEAAASWAAAANKAAAIVNSARATVDKAVDVWGAAATSMATWDMAAAAWDAASAAVDAVTINSHVPGVNSAWQAADVSYFAAAHTKSAAAAARSAAAVDIPAASSADFARVDKLKAQIAQSLQEHFGKSSKKAKAIVERIPTNAPGRLSNIDENIRGVVQDNSRLYKNLKDYLSWRGRTKGANLITADERLTLRALMLYALSGFSPSKTMGGMHSTAVRHALDIKRMDAQHLTTTLDAANPFTDTPDAITLPVIIREIQQLASYRSRPDHKAEPFKD